ncbi:hypothetical protein T07_11325 [Trichinella nelsoni]|uniref:Secreted protein n=1 Tax=Trichinella nelsoni TaxID=6336 RepID=A0A0V0SKA6_9BILA|nr:hypothetical protein T07_11325 [Trichinella nelsoni]
MECSFLLLALRISSSWHSCVSCSGMREYSETSMELYILPPWLLNFPPWLPQTPSGELKAFERSAFFHDSSELHIAAIPAFFMISLVCTHKCKSRLQVTTKKYRNLAPGVARGYAPGHKKICIFP